MIAVAWPKKTIAYSGVGDYTFEFPVIDKQQLLVEFEDLTTGTAVTLRLYEDYDITFTKTVATQDYSTRTITGGTVQLLSTQNTGNLLISRKQRLEEKGDYRFGGRQYIPNFENKFDMNIRVLQQVWITYCEAISSPWWRGPWVANRSYRVGDLVSYNSALYLVAKAHVSSVAADDITAGNLYTWLDYTSITSLLPGVSVGDAKKSLAVNVGETAYEHRYQVEVPGVHTPEPGEIPVIDTASSIYGSYQLIRRPHPRMRFKSDGANGRILLNGWAEYYLSAYGPMFFKGVDKAYTLTSLATNTWSFVYIDRLTPSSRELDETLHIYDSTEVPSYDVARGGWYDTSDRLCILPVFGLSSSTLRDFHHVGDSILWQESSVLYTNGTFPATTWTSINLSTLASIIDYALLNLEWAYTTANANHQTRAAGSTAATGWFSGRTHSSSTEDVSHRTWEYVNKLKKIEAYSTASCSLKVHDLGFKLPRGM